MAEFMRAVDIKDGAGPIENLFMNPQVPMPELAKPSDALIKVVAFGLNRMDLLQREGSYPPPPHASKILGIEFSGVITKLGSESEQSFKVGDEVFGLAYGGGYAEYISVSTHMLIHKPKELSWEECAGIPETWMTATQALWLIGEFSAGKSVLWHAGASSVSISGIQLSHGAGASAVFATTRSDEKCKFCVEQLGCTAAYNSETTDWAQEVLDATGGKGVDIILDFIGANFLAPNLQALARDGRIVNLASLGPPRDPGGADIGLFIKKRARFEGTSLRSRDEDYQRKLRDMVVANALPQLVDKTFKVHIEKIYSWGDIQEAHSQLEQNKTKGKLICRVD